MTANKIDTTKYNAMVANASPNVKISSTVFKNFIGDVKSVVDHNADEVDAAMKKTADSDLNMNNRSVTNINTINLRAPTILTIDSNKSITVSRTMHRVTTSGGADELHTINGGNENDLLLLRIVSAANPVTIKHGMGNIGTPDGVDISLTNVRQWVLLINTSVDWHVIASGVGLNSAGGTMTGRLQINNQLYYGTGSPEGVVTAPPGSIYQNTSGGTNTTLYVKRSGTGNTGWFAVA